MTTFSQMSIPILAIVIEGLLIVQSNCDRRVQQLESENSDDAIMEAATKQFNDVSGILWEAQHQLLVLNGTL